MGDTAGDAIMLSMRKREWRPAPLTMPTQAKMAITTEPKVDIENHIHAHVAKKRDGSARASTPAAGTGGGAGRGRRAGNPGQGDAGGWRWGRVPGVAGLGGLQPGHSAVDEMVSPHPSEGRWRGDCQAET